MQPLTSHQRAYLRKIAHSLDAKVHLGKQGLTPALVQAVATQLLAHELIKVKFGEFKDERQTLAEELTSLTDSVLVAVIGNVALLYRPHPERNRRSVSLPEVSDEV